MICLLCLTVRNFLTNWSFWGRMFPVQQKLNCSSFNVDSNFQPQLALRNSSHKSLRRGLEGGGGMLSIPALVYLTVDLYTVFYPRVL